MTKKRFSDKKKFFSGEKEPNKSKSNRKEKTKKRKRFNPPVGGIEPPAGVLRHVTIGKPRDMKDTDVSHYTIRDVLFDSILGINNGK